MQWKMMATAMPRGSHLFLEDLQSWEDVESVVSLTGKE